MGTIYINGQEVVSYANGEVKDKTGRFLACYNETNGEIYYKASVANNYFATYRNGRIYRKNGFTESEVGKIISERDWNGYDGKILDTSGNAVAFYRGEECVGLAAAAAVSVFHLDNSGTSDSKTKDSNSNDVQTNISENSNVSTSESGGGCISAIIGILTAILLFVPILLWNFLPLVLCIGSFAIVILDDVIDFNNDVDSLIIGLLIIYIPIMLSGICNILINFNSIREKITKKQANFCRLIHNAGIILSLITRYIYNCSFAMGSSLSLAPKPTPLGFFFGILSSVILWITPIITYIFLRKCKKL